jgi:hypothetical protein
VIDTIGNGAEFGGVRHAACGERTVSDTTGNRRGFGSLAREGALV